MKLALYKYDTCGYCRLVMRVVDELGIGDRVEMRDVLRSPERRAELYQARGRGTVPVLRIEDDEGSVQWMGESRDIAAWLRSRFGDSD